MGDSLYPWPTAILERCGVDHLVVSSSSTRIVASLKEVT